MVAEKKQKVENFRGLLFCRTL